MSPKRLVLMVEGQGDVEAAPTLVKRLLAEHSFFDAVSLDPHPIRVGEYSKISKNGFAEWKRFLRVAAMRRNLGGCVLLLDGDSKTKVKGQPFCAMRAAQRLAAEAMTVGAGAQFSVAIVFACMEFESWLIAGVPSLVNQPFTDGRKEISELPSRIPDNPEQIPRDAKGWFRRVMRTGYSATRDQAELTRLVDLNAIRAHPSMRSFQRMESAIKEVVDAIREGSHAVTPLPQKSG